MKNGLSSRHLLFDLPGIDLRKLTYLLENRWDDPEVVKGMKTIFLSLQAMNSRIPSPQIYRYYFQILSVLGSGVQGEAISGSFKKPSGSVEIYGGVVAIKSAIRAQTINSAQSWRDTQREFFVCRQLEKVNSPIFIKAYGLMLCTGSYEKDDTRKLSFCANDLPISLITQFIPGKTIDHLNISELDFYRCFLIFVYGLREAQNVMLTHHDPHATNVIYRKLPKTWAIPIKSNGRTKYIKTNLIPVLLDYGLARINTPRGPIYADGDFWLGNGVTPNYSPLHDVYKFLFWAIYVKPSFFNGFKFLIDFFYESLTHQQFVRLRDDYYIIPNALRNVGLDTFIEYLENNTPARFRNMISDDTGGNHIYGIYNDRISFFNTIGVDLAKYATLTDSFQWYMYRSLSDQNLEKEKLTKDLLKILPSQMNNLIFIIDKAITEQIPKWTRRYKLDPRDEDHIKILGYMGDVAWTVKTEITTISLALNDMLKENRVDRVATENYRQKLSAKVAQLQTALNQYLNVYEYYLQKARTDKKLEKLFVAIYPPSLS